jgi:hypothetical protein
MATAKLLGVCPHRLRMWRRGQAIPRFDIMLKIVKASRGQVTLTHLHTIKNGK